MKPFLVVCVVAVSALLGGCVSQPIETGTKPTEIPNIGPEPRVDYAPLKLGESFPSVYTCAIRQGAVNLDASIPAFEEAEPTETIISIETRQVELPAALAQKLLGADGASQVFGVPTAESTALVNALRQDHQAVLVSAPRLTCFDGQRANISIVTQHAFVSGFEIMDAKNSRVLDPVIETVTDGLVLALRPEFKDGKIALEINLVEAQLVKPIAEGAIELDGNTVKLQLPVLHVQQLATSVLLEDGGTIMVSRAKATDKETCVVMFVTAKKAQ